MISNNLIFITYVSRQCTAVVVQGPKTWEGAVIWSLSSFIGWGGNSFTCTAPARTFLHMHSHNDYSIFSLDSLDSIDEQGEPRVTIFSVAMSLVRRKELGKPLPLPFRPKNRATLHWLKALHLTRHSIDPWKSQFGELLAEKAVRHQYNALAKTWKTEKVLVKMEKTSFAAGAMRECFRL